MAEPARIDVAALDALFAPYDRTNAPGFAVGVALDGTPGCRRGVGSANIELPVALSPTIRMRIGSTTKHFTALAVMLLAEAGKLSIDDSPRRHLPELPAWAEAMTLRQLMAHTSGMRDSLDLILHSAGPGKPAPPDFQLGLLAGLHGVNVAPGESWNYNNGGYVLLAEIVSRIAGTPFAAFLRDRVFVPLGMNDTLVRALDTDLVPNSATPHVPQAGGGYARGVFGASIGGEGGIVSTVDDMLRWLRHMSDPQVGTRETWAAMRTPLTTHGYGLGLFMDEHRGLDTVHHAGAVMGGACRMLKVLEPELDIILITNGRGSLDVHRLVEAIIDRCISGLPPAPADVPGEPVVGTFHSERTGRLLSLGAVEGRQTLTVGAMTLPARRDAQGRLSVALLPTDMRVRPLGTDVVEVDEFGAIDRLARVIPPADADARSLAARYACPDAALTAAITTGPDGAATLRLAGPLGSTDYALIPLGADLWEGQACGMLPLRVTLEFAGGGFRLTTGRTVRLPFARET